MTEVEFRFNVPDKIDYACRLLRKAVAAGARVVVVADAGPRARLDEALWTFSPLDFLPHCDAGAEPALQGASPVILAESAQGLPPAQVLLNLGERVPEGFERFERLIELVTAEPADRQQARARWRHYEDRGYAIGRLDMAAQQGAASRAQAGARDAG